MNVDAHQWQDHFLKLDLIDRAQAFVKMRRWIYVCAPLTDMSKDLGKKNRRPSCLAAFRTSKSFSVVRRENQTNAECLARSRG